MKIRRNILIILAMWLPWAVSAQVQGVLTIAGSVLNMGSSNGPAGSASFHDPTGLAIDNVGNIYVADTWNHVVRKLSPAGWVSTLAGQMGIAGSKDATGTNALFNNPSGIALGSNGLLYVTDTGNHTIRCITSNGVVTTLAGLAGESGATNATGALARFNSPLGIAVDQTSTIYVADSGNHLIRKVTPAGTVSTLAGLTGVWGSADGTNSTALFNGPVGVAADGFGNIFVADSNNHTIRKVTPSGVVTTFAGSAGMDGSTDGMGNLAFFGKPAELKFDRNHDLFVVDSFYHTLRKITTNGVVTTVAGQAGNSGAADGLGQAARFFSPYGAAFDPRGNLYVSDTYNETLRLVYIPITVSLNRKENGFTLEWPAVTGNTYQVQFQEMPGGAWQNLGGPVTATNSSGSQTDNSPAASTRFYRVKSEQSP